MKTNKLLEKYKKQKDVPLIKLKMLKILASSFKALNIKYVSELKFENILAFSKSILSIEKEMQNIKDYVLQESFNPAILNSKLFVRIVEENNIVDFSIDDEEIFEYINIV